MITVIIPIYNVKPYLNPCLQSVANQSYTDFECLLIDDGSTDGSGEICDGWAKDDSRFHAFHQTNQGVSAARNKGLELAEGELVTFVDSDDWIDKDYLSAMMSQQKSGRTDLTVSGITCEFENRASQSFIPRHTDCFELEESGFDSFLDLHRKYLLYGPYTKLYRRDIIRRHDVKFDADCSYGEDLLFNFQYLKHVRHISSVSQSNYHYRILGGGTLSSMFRADMFDLNYSQWKIMQTFYIGKRLWNQKSQALLYRRLWGIIYDGIFLYPRLDKKDSNYIKRILSIPEIKQLRKHQNEFGCSNWIKQAILSRADKLFFLYFTFTK